MGKKNELLGRAITALGKDASTNAQIEEIVEQIIVTFGGANAVAQAFYDTWMTAESPATKARMLEMIFKLIEMTSARTQNPLDQLTEPELHDALKGMLDKDE